MTALAPRDLVLLLPRLPANTTVAAGAPGWDAAVVGWDIDRVARDGELALVVGGRAARVAKAATIAVVGRLSRRARSRLVERGYEVASYAVRAGDGGVEVRPSEGWRASVHVADLVTAAPAAIAASGAGPLSTARFDDDPRRRAALVAGDVVVKVERERAARNRGETEQEVLAALHERGVGAAVPRPLGSGVTGGVAWSAESRVDGRPLHSTPDAAVHDRLARWLDDLAVATRAERAGEPTERDLLPLRGEAAGLVGSLPALAGVPSVLAHGDLATGFNVLVDGDTFSVIDWETARPTGLPLADLLPMLCLGSARVAGCRSVDEGAAHILALCRGESSESGWLFGHVRRHLGLLGVPPKLAGTLAALAWGALASMRLVYRELVPGAPDWTTSADVVSSAWLADPRLGARWPALTEHLGAT